MQLGSHVVWLWCRPTAAALIQPQALEFPHATGAAIKSKKKKKKCENKIKIKLNGKEIVIREMAGGMRKMISG